MNRRLSIAEKRRILDMLDEPGATQTSVAKRLSISRKSVYNAVANRETIVNFANPEVITQRSHLKVNEKFQRVNELTLEWFIGMRKKHGEIPLVESLVCRKAVDFAQKLGQSNFKASKGWFRSWSARYGIQSYKVSLCCKCHFSSLDLW